MNNDDVMHSGLAWMSLNCGVRASVLQLPVSPAALFHLSQQERQAGKSKVSCFKLDLMHCQNAFPYLTLASPG